MSYATVPEGMQVWYEHERAKMTLLREGETPELVLSPRGGTTVAKLWLPSQDPKVDAPIATGEAECNSADNYNKRIGRSIALGRALKALR